MARVMMSDEDKGSKKSMASMCQQSHKLFHCLRLREGAFRMYISLASYFVLESTYTAVLQYIVLLCLLPGLDSKKAMR
jgi:hypothetical protein